MGRDVYPAAACLWPVITVALFTVWCLVSLVTVPVWVALVTLDGIRARHTRTERELWADH
jgi:hypothetical protein